MLYVKEREYLLSLLDDLIKFRLVDCTGGLMALRCNADHLLFSGSGEAFRRWHCGLEDFIVTDNEGAVVEKHERGAAHGFLVALELFKQFPLCNAVLHTHSEYSHAFSALDLAVPPAAHLMQTLGEVPCIKVEDQRIKEEYFRQPYPIEVPAAMEHRPEIVAVNQRIVPQIKEKLGHRKHELEKHGLAFTTYQHGIYVFARNMDEAFNNLARVEASARTYIYGSLILGRERLEAEGRA
ncbi:MAG: class II aldolase/adducin family protein [Blastocatellales bacterium]